MTLRKHYGLTLFGQGGTGGAAAGRAGVQLVTVIWDEYGEANSAWDTHNRQIRG